jgi:hypothetical protein
VLQHLLLSQEEGSREEDPCIGQASVFCTHAWSYPFVDFVATCLTAGKTSDFFWIDVFCVPQHSVSSVTFPEDFFYSTFRDGIQQIGRLLVVLNSFCNPICFKRSWCLWELFCAADCGTSVIEFALFPREQTRLLHMSTLLKMIPDVATAQAFKETDREAILEAINASIGSDALNLLCEDLFADAQIDQAFASVARTEHDFIQFSMLSFSTRGVSKIQHYLADTRFSYISSFGLNGAYFSDETSKRLMAGALGGSFLQKLTFYGKSVDNGLPLPTLARTGLRHLKELVIVDGSVTDNGIEALATFVLSRDASRLEKLDLGSNPLISDQGAMALAQALSGNRMLKSLGLNGCPSIHDVGIIALVDVLQNTNPSLTLLDLNVYPESRATPETLAALRNLNDSAGCPGRSKWCNVTDYDLCTYAGRCPSIE